jgi:hypothetical protein
MTTSKSISMMDLNPVLLPILTPTHLVGEVEVDPLSRILLEALDKPDKAPDPDLLQGRDPRRTNQPAPKKIIGDELSLATTEDVAITVVTTTMPKPMPHSGTIPIMLHPLMTTPLCPAALGSTWT